jgi:hypothetical protein
MHKAVFLDVLAFVAPSLLYCWPAPFWFTPGNDVQQADEEWTIHDRTDTTRKQGEK